ncbi:MAG: hypothetical protein JST90_02325 [Bacteroidetes bacterium]|nr:hypothetical protein [Bacteroidota bacterium]
MKEIDILKASKFYSEMLDSFASSAKIDVDYSATNVSKAIYFHVVKMKYAGWKHRVNFNRFKKYTSAELFQDIVAFYLKAILPSHYQLELERKVNKSQPDIAIYIDGKCVFIIEVKTSIGWQRPAYKSEDPYVDFRNRVNQLSNDFSIPRQNILYIFEDHGNVGVRFSSKFWDRKNHRPIMLRPQDFPYSIIYPLFNGTDPSYWEKNTIDRKKEYLDISDAQILEAASKNIVFPFEKIVELLMERIDNFLLPNV